jgi:serine protease Do
MKTNMMSLLALGLTISSLTALEAPKKIEPLAPNQAPTADPVPAPAEENAAPASEATPDAQKPVENMPQVGNDKAYLGLGLDRLHPALAEHLGIDEDSAAFVRVIDPEGPAAAAGLKEADIIVSVDGQNIKSHDCLSRLMEKHRAGDEVKITFLHRGVSQEKSLKLAARPAMDVAGVDDGAEADDLLPREMLKGLPQEMRDAIEKNLKAMGANGAIAGGAQVIPMDANGMPELQKRVEKMMQGMQMKVQPGVAGADVQMKSTLKMMDKDGNIEISRDGDSCEAKVFDKQGELLWSGPYQTPQDKAAVPPPVRDRLEALNLDTSGKGIQLRMLPRR